MPDLSFVHAADTMPGPNWNDLPTELLLKIASSSGTGVMWDVSRTWRTSLEGVATQLTIIGSDLPLSLPTRFLSLTSLNLQGCTSEVTAASLELLKQLPLTNLAIRTTWEDLSEEVTGGLRGLSLASLDLGLEDPQRATDALLERLKGLPLTSLNLGDSEVSGPGLASLQGMPLAALVLDGIDMGDNSFEMLRGMPLTDLSLHWCLRVLDAGCEVLLGMPLTRLNLAGSGISNIGLEYLKGHQSQSWI